MSSYCTISFLCISEIASKKSAGEVVKVSALSLRSRAGGSGLGITVVGRGSLKSLVYRILPSPPKAGTTFLSQGGSLIPAPPPTPNALYKDTEHLYALSAPDNDHAALYKDAEHLMTMLHCRMRMSISIHS